MFVSTEDTTLDTSSQPMSITVVDEAMPESDSGIVAMVAESRLTRLEVEMAVVKDHAAELRAELAMIKSDIVGILRHVRLPSHIHEAIESHYGVLGQAHIDARARSRSPGREAPGVERGVERGTERGHHRGRDSGIANDRNDRNGRNGHRHNYRYTRPYQAHASRRSRSLSEYRGPRGAQYAYARREY